MLLVDDDQPQPRQRREDGEPRADDELRVATGRGKPMLKPLRRGESAMQNCDARTLQRRCNAQLKLWREVDFRHEQQHLPALGDDALRRGEVDLGFTAAGHALQQRGREAS